MWNPGPEKLTLPLEWKKPRMVFVCSMSDLFHDAVPVHFIEQVFEVMCKADWHVIQILTKRSARLADLSSQLPWRPHVWIGVSVENQDFTFRIDHLRATDSSVRFVSFEPLVGPIADIDLPEIDWVIVGGESGPGARPMEEGWVVSLRDQCQAANSSSSSGVV